jgi:hypothetical protein
MPQQHAAVLQARNTQDWQMKEAQGAQAMK